MEHSSNNTVSPAAASPQPPLRLFVAVFAPELVQEAAEQAVARLRGRGHVGWVARERLHLTLKFLGPTAPEQVAQLQEALQETANRFLHFVVKSGSVGAFPSVRKPQTLWLDVGGEALDTLVALGTAVDEAVHALGFPREARAYRPHLTIGRVRSPRGLADLAREIQQAAREPAESVPWPVDELCLVRSDLRPAGPEYSILCRFPLRPED